MRLLLVTLHDDDRRAVVAVVAPDCAVVIPRRVVAAVCVIPVEAISVEAVVAVGPVSVAGVAEQRVEAPIVDELGGYARRVQRRHVGGIPTGHARLLEREVFGRVAMFFEGKTAEELAPLGELRTPSVADLFVAKMQGVA